MTVNLNRKVGVSSAALGGYCARQLPAATNYGVRYETLTFRPTIDDTTWQVADQNATLYSLTNTDLATGTYLSTYEGSIQYSGTGGPGSGTPKMRVTPLGWRSLGYQGSIVTPGIGAGGITLESWIDFGPHPQNLYGSTKTAEVACGISAEPIATDNSNFFNPPAITSPRLLMTAYVSVDIEGDPAFITLEARYQSASGARWITKTVLTGQDSDGAEWNHYACEIKFDGQINLYFNGTLLDLGDASIGGSITPENIPSNFIADLDSFVPYTGGSDTNWINAETSDSTRRSYIDVAGVRYTKGLRYNGESFSPPAV